MLLHLQHEASNNVKVKLKRVTLKSSGLYRCEVSAEAPNFSSAEGEGRMEVICKCFSSIDVTYISTFPIFLCLPISRLSRAFIVIWISRFVDICVLRCFIYKTLNFNNIWICQNIKRIKLNWMFVQRFNGSIVYP